MRVKVAFDPAAPDTVGTFSVAKRQAPHEDEEEPPTPSPVGEVEYGEFTTLFEFDFQPRNAELFWISESRWLSGKGGTLQFIAAGKNTFVYSQVSTSGSVSTWTALRSGISGAPAEDRPAGRRSMLQRWWRWLGALAVFLAYRAVKDNLVKPKLA